MKRSLCEAPYNSDEAGHFIMTTDYSAVVMSSQIGGNSQTCSKESNNDSGPLGISSMVTNEDPSNKQQATMNSSPNVENYLTLTYLRHQDWNARTDLHKIFSFLQTSF